MCGPSGRIICSLACAGGLRRCRTTVAAACKAGKQSSRPSAMALACGDGAATASALAWSKRGGSHATAHGKVSVRTCMPDCATGGVADYTGTQVLGQRRNQVYKILYKSIRIL